MRRLLKNNNFRSGILAVIVLFVISLPVIIPLFKSGFFLTDDGEWMIIRFSAFYDALADGQFPVRWLGRLYHGYGYPVANFLYPGFMYIGVPIHFLGFGFVNTIKIIMGASMVGSAIFTYFWLANLFPKRESLVGALFYVYLPYHLFDLYSRGSVGELFALAVVPFIFWQIERKSLLFASLGLAFLILSHNTLALLFFPVILMYMFLDLVIVKKRIHLLFTYAGIVLFGNGMSTFFWLPALFDLHYTIFSKTQISEWDQYFATFSIIGLPIFVVVIFTAALFILRLAHPAKHRLTLLFLTICIISIIFATPVSSLFWEMLPVSVIQFPFRFLSVTILTVSFLAAFVMSVVPVKYKAIVGGVLFLILFFSAGAYLSPKEFFDKGDMYYATNQSTTTTQDEYRFRYAEEKVYQAPEEAVIAIGGTITDIRRTSHVTAFDITALEETKVVINAMYFPGWEVFVNQKRMHISYDNPKGVITFSLPKGVHHVEAVFTETPVRMFANLFSLISLLSLIAIVLYTRVVGVLHLKKQ